jgi:hypothetical protein
MSGHCQMLLGLSGDFIDECVAGGFIGVGSGK